MAHSSISGEVFSILSVSIPPVPSYPVTSVHEVRIRRNAPKIPTANDSRSIFLKNIPVDSTESHFRALFASLVGPGKFESIAFTADHLSPLSVDPAATVRISQYGRKRKRDEAELEEHRREEEAANLPPIWSRKLKRSGSTAIALFADEKSVLLVLKAISKVQRTKKYPVWGEGVSQSTPCLGTPWIATHIELCRADKGDVRDSVHAFFNVFNRKEKEATEISKRLRNEPDEDGFITVTRGGRNKPANKFEAEAARQRMVEKQAKATAERTGFYRFQLREKRKAEQEELVKKFEEDRKRVTAMKEKRGKFKPES